MASSLPTPVLVKEKENKGSRTPTEMELITLNETKKVPLQTVLSLSIHWSIGPVYSELITILLLCLLRTYRKPKTILSPWTGLAQFRCFLIFTWKLIRNYGEWRQKQPKKLYKHLQGMMRRIVDSLKNVISPE